MSRPVCCNHNCEQGDTCPARQAQAASASEWRAIGRLLSSAVAIWIGLMVVAALTGCTPEMPIPTSGPDQCLRREIFQQCLNSVPPGPSATKYNDWDEVVDECETAALRQSYRLFEHIKPECRS